MRSCDGWPTGRDAHGATRGVRGRTPRFPSASLRISTTYACWALSSTPSRACMAAGATSSASSSRRSAPPRRTGRGRTVRADRCGADVEHLDRVAKRDAESGRAPSAARVRPSPGCLDERSRATSAPGRAARPACSPPAPSPDNSAHTRTKPAPADRGIDRIPRRAAHRPRRGPSRMSSGETPSGVQASCSRTS